MCFTRGVLLAHYPAYLLFLFFSYGGFPGFPRLAANERVNTSGIIPQGERIKKGVKKG
jgi:hypothetical protein